MPQLLTPVSVGTLKLKNRLVMPPMATYLTENGGFVTPALLEHYGARAKGGQIGLIVTEHCYFMPQGIAYIISAGITHSSSFNSFSVPTTARGITSSRSAMIR